MKVKEWMKVKVTFDVEVPEKFVIEKEQPFESALEKITYRKLPTSYEKSVKNGETEIITIEEAAKDYFLASTFSDEYCDSISCSVPREEIINRILQGGSFDEIPCNVQNEAFATAIQALEQEPCEDAISRQYLLDNCVVDKVTMPYVPISKIENAPSVTPQQKIGHWIFKNDNVAIPTGYFQCSECNSGKLLHVDNYCPSCGVQMESVERAESEE